MLRSISGHIHIISVVVLCFALIGAWFVHKSYQEQKLKENLIKVATDYKNLADSFVKDPADKKKVDEIFSKISASASKDEIMRGIEEIKTIVLTKGNDYLKQEINNAVKR